MDDVIHPVFIIVTVQGNVYKNDIRREVRIAEQDFGLGADDALYMVAERNPSSRYSSSSSRSPALPSTTRIS